jgi:hypothetical protein
VACEEGLDQAAIGRRRLVERDLVAVDLQRDPGVGMAADPSPQCGEQRPERAGERDDELRPLERGDSGSAIVVANTLRPVASSWWRK